MEEYIIHYGSIQNGQVKSILSTIKPCCLKLWLNTILKNIFHKVMNTGKQAFSPSHVKYNFSASSVKIQLHRTVIHSALSPQNAV